MSSQCNGLGPARFAEANRLQSAICSKASESDHRFQLLSSWTAAYSKQNSGKKTGPKESAKRRKKSARAEWNLQCGVDFRFRFRLSAHSFSIFPFVPGTVLFVFTCPTVETFCCLNKNCTLPPTQPERVSLFVNMSLPFSLSLLCFVVTQSQASQRPAQVRFIQRKQACHCCHRPLICSSSRRKSAG